MPGTLSATEWSQAGWRLEGDASIDECEQKLIGPVMLRHLPKDGLIVDAGCGTGKWVAFLHRLGYRVVGLDISREALGVARSVAPEVAVALADTQRTPLRDASVDAVLSLGVVEHDERGPLEGLRELRRLLKPGGLLVLDVPFNNWFRRLVTNPIASFVTRRRRRAGWPLAFAEYRFDLGELRGFLAATGFEIIAEHPDEYLPPHNIGLWVDYHNITFDPHRPPGADQLFRLTGTLGRVAEVATRRWPWLVCGEVTLLARRTHDGSRP